MRNSNRLPFHLCSVDTSEYTRNSDFLPTRLSAQQDAITYVFNSKKRSHSENNVGLMNMSSPTPRLMATFTNNVTRIARLVKDLQPAGSTNLLTSIRVAHLVLKHRQTKNHKMRILIFIASPVEEDDQKLTDLAKRLKKEKVDVDIVNFDDAQVNKDKLDAFIKALNGGPDAAGDSHLLNVSSDTLADAIASSPLVAQGTPSNLLDGVDPEVDPELATALQISLIEAQGGSQSNNGQRNSNNHSGSRSSSNSQSDPSQDSDSRSSNNPESNQ